MRGIISDRLLDEHMFAFCQERARYHVVRISWRCHGSGIDHLNKFVERFGRYRTEFPTDGAAPERIHIIHCGELSRWNFRIQPRMVRSEEHTSELQSHHDLVCRLLLEKKKKEIYL